MRNYYRKQLEEVAQKFLAFISKYERTQLTFYDELRVFDPRQCDSMPNDIKKYPNLFTADKMEVLCASGEWKLYWKQRIVDDWILMCCNGGREQRNPI